jgi:hypothetical protein
MAEKTEIASRRKGALRYERNPFIADALASTKTRMKRIKQNTRGDKMLVINDTSGEVISDTFFVTTHEVDQARFVKLYVSAVKGITEMTNAGTRVFELLFNRVQENVGKDKIHLTFPSIDQNQFAMSETTFYRGMKELIKNRFIAESTTPGIYFLNPECMWNGDRLSFVQNYVRSSTKPKHDDLTMDLFGDIAEQPMLETTTTGETAA